MARYTERYGVHAHLKQKQRAGNRCRGQPSDDNKTAQDVPNDDCNEPNVCKPTSGHKGFKQISA